MELQINARIRSVLGLMALLLGGMAWAQSSPDRAGSPHPGDQYTLFVELHQPYASNRVTFQKMLKEEGYESFAEGEKEVTLVLSEEQIGKLFQARIEFRKVGASASDRVITQPYLEGARIPGRFGKMIRRVYFDPQRG